MAISKLPRPVTYTYPNGLIKKGKVIKEVGIKEHGTTMNYYNLIQILKMDRGEKWIRFAYYVKNFGQSDKYWRWGSQTTLTLTPKTFRKLIKMAEKEGIL